MEPKEALSVQDFCNLYSISRATFYRELKARRLHVSKIGRSTRIKRSECDRWLANLSNLQASPQSV